jgi:hypothetical protein
MAAVEREIARRYWTAAVDSEHACNSHELRLTLRQLGATFVAHQVLLHCSNTDKVRALPDMTSVEGPE